MRRAVFLPQLNYLSFLVVVVAIASTHYAYPRRDGQAELAWVAGLHTEMVYPRRSPIPELTGPDTLEHLYVDRDQRVPLAPNYTIFATNSNPSPITA